MNETTALHDQRLEAVLHTLQESKAQSVLDLGCGEGFLVEKLADMPQFKKIIAIDICEISLNTAQERLENCFGVMPDHVLIKHASFTETNDDFRGFHAAVMLETIEHIDPDKLSTVENAVFADLRPDMVVITTPNSDYNAILGVPVTRMRHPDHRFEWPRDKFRRWCLGIAGRNGYAAVFQDIGGAHPHYGGPTQMAIFNKKDIT